MKPRFTRAVNITCDFLKAGSWLRGLAARAAHATALQARLRGACLWWNTAM